MAKEKCKKCTDPATKEGLCEKHFRLKQQADQQAAAQKLQMEKQLKEAKDKEAARVALVKKNEDAKVGKAKKINEIATLWNGQVSSVVAQVLRLRHDNPTRKGINAGTNTGLATIPGGTGNPITFALPANPYGITKAEVYAEMTGFEGSDSGSFKFRVSEVFVHGH